MAIIQRHVAYGAPHNTPKIIVVHAMAEHVAIPEGKYIYAPDFLESQGLSAHALALPNGDIIRMRNDTDGAYHARGFNTNSLGIEMLVPGMHNYASFLRMIDHPYLFAQQYRAAVEQCREWVDLYGIAKIVRHSDISPGRKVDPGRGFPWEAFLQEVMA